MKRAIVIVSVPAAVNDVAARVFEVGEEIIEGVNITPAAFAVLLESGWAELTKVSTPLATKGGEAEAEAAPTPKRRAMKRRVNKK